MRCFVIVGLLGVVAAACGGASVPAGGEWAYDGAPVPEAGALGPETAPAAKRLGMLAPAPQVPEAPVERRLVRTAELELSVANTQGAATLAEQIVDRHGGHVSDSSAWRQEGQMHHQLTLRVPAEALDEVLAELRGLATRLEREALHTEDVTAQYVDLTARLRNLTLAEEELQALLSESRTRGESVEGVMAIYRELTGIRSQLDSLQGRLNLLESQTTLSRIELMLHPDASVASIRSGDWRPGVVVRNSLRALVAVLQGLVNLAIFTAIVLLPTGVVLYGALWIPLRAWWRRRAAARAG